MDKKKNMKSRLMGFEYEALSLLLHFWATKNSHRNRSKKWPIKLSKLRQAVIAGTRKGMHEKRIPRELVFVEYNNTMEALRQLKQQLHSYDYFLETIGSGAINLIKIRYKATYKGEIVEFTRPVPVPQKGAVRTVKMFLAGSKQKSETAHDIVGKRLRCSTSKVEDNVLSGLPKRHHPQAFQQVLVGIFLDLCSLGPRVGDMPLLAKILKVLFSTKCHLLMIEYLIQNAHRVEQKLFTGEYDTYALCETCDNILRQAKDEDKICFEPFTRLVRCS
ncbi:MAG: hypothetical protein ACXABY_07515 [Candidatus Thorarchaeota archaeon]|jgi:hypothetical protein